MELEKELQESIKKNLPQQVGEVLKTRLEQADKDSTEVKRLKEMLDKYADDKIGLEKQIEEYKQFDSRNSLLESREKEIETKEKQLEVETLKYQLQSEKDKTTFSQNVALGLVRNVEYRKNIFDNESGVNGTTDQYGNQVYTNTSKSYNSTETIS